MYLIAAENLLLGVGYALALGTHSEESDAIDIDRV